MADGQALGSAADTAPQELLPPSVSKLLHDGSTRPAFTNNQQSFEDVFRNATLADRELAEKAAKALILLRSLHAELKDWRWPNNFNSPEPAHHNIVNPSCYSETTVTPSDVVHNAREDGFVPGRLTFWGCLPASLVLSHLDRLEKVRSEYDSKDYEELTRSVSTFRARTMGDLTNIRSTESSDLASLTTVLVLQVLAMHARLESLLAVWSARLFVLQMVPDFFDMVGLAERAMADAWGFVDNARKLSRDHDLEDVEQCAPADTYERLRDVVEKKIARLGRKVDSMLDILVDCEDTIPDVWVDLVENLEIDYSDWTVEAQRKLLRQEFQLDFGSSHRGPHSRNLSRLFISSGSEHEMESVSMPGAWQRNEEHDSNETENSSSDISTTKTNEVLQQWTLPPSPDSHLMKTPASMDILEIRGRTKEESSASCGGAFVWPQVPGSTWPFKYGYDGQSSEDVFCATNGHELLSPSLFSNGSTQQENQSSGNKEWPREPMGLGIMNIETKSFTRLPLQRLDTDFRFSGENQLHVIKRTPSPERPERSSQPRLERSLTGNSVFQRSNSPNSKSTETEIELRMGGILATVPADIQFAKNGHSKLPRSVVKNSYPSPMPSPKVERQISLTITPAYPKENRLANLSPSSDIKLYHLSQNNAETQTKPVKLFLRLVGEQRVMVRVGGGWADLGDWLRAYTSHHSHASFVQNKSASTAFPTLALLSTPGARATTPVLSSPASPMQLRPRNSQPSTPLSRTAFAPLSTNSPVIAPIRSMTTSRRSGLSSPSSAVSPSSPKSLWGGQVRHA